MAADLQQVLSKLFTVLRRGDPNRGSHPDLTLAQLSILLTLLDSGPIRMTELAARERVRTPTTTVAIRRLEAGPGQAVAGSFRHAGRPGRGDSGGLVQHREALATRRAHLAAMLGKLTIDERDSVHRALQPATAR